MRRLPPGTASRRPARRSIAHGGRPRAPDRGRVRCRTGVRRCHAAGRRAREACVRSPEARVLGVDPGLTRCGLGAVEGRPGAPLRLVAAGVVRTSADDDIGTRLLAIEREIERWLDEVRPSTVAVERVFAQHNVRTVMGTAQAAAIAIVCAARRGLPVALHTPSEVKAAITGNGDAGKRQVGAMVTRLLRLDAMPKPADAADALALAICHVWRGGAQHRLAEALARARRPAAPAWAGDPDGGGSAR
nr:crossover junction endodeoxyribonuclease RuvC [Actinomycetales bacterium]